jgi:RNA polymerase sigma factor (sigma-70 family)
MADRVMQSLVHAVRRRAALDPAAGSDSELLSRFVQTRDPSAFELMVWRHGAMVEAVCRRILGRSAEVEDAFQATFMALLKQANSIRRESSAAPWLHRVALRASMRLQRAAERRLRREQRSARRQSVKPPDPDSFELGTILHEEIDRLPDRFRLPVITCLLEGRSVAEASRLLEVPKGTILSRLSRARDRLRRTLIKRGVAPVIAAAIGIDEADAAVSTTFVRGTLQVVNKFHLNPAATSPVARVAEGVVREMMLKKIRTAACISIAVGLMGLGTVLMSLPQAQAQPQGGPPSTRRVGDLDRLQGVWMVESIRRDGRNERADAMRMAVKGKTLIVFRQNSSDADTYSIKVDSTTNPPSIDLQNDGKSMPGIYEFHGDELRLCYCETFPDRPMEFASQRGAHVVLMTLKRQSPGEAAIGSGSSNDVQGLLAENARLKKQLSDERARNERLVAQISAMKQHARAIEEQGKETASAREKLGRNDADRARENAAADDAKKLLDAWERAALDSHLTDNRLLLDKQRALEEALRELAQKAAKSERMKGVEQELKALKDAEAKIQSEMDETRRHLNPAAASELMRLKNLEAEKMRVQAAARAQELQKLKEMEDSNLHKAKQDIDRTVEELTRQRWELDKQKAEYEKSKPLKKPENVDLQRSKAELEKADANLKLAEVERSKAEQLDRQLEAQIRQSQARVAQAQADRDRYAAELEQAKAAIVQAQKQLDRERTRYREPMAQAQLDVGMKPDCSVEWKENWYPAKILKKEKDRWLIHYIGYEKSWDEWVGKDRIKFGENK